MATVRKFEDMLAWQKSRELTKSVYANFKTCSDKGFIDQIQRASVSVMSNIAEGFERGTKESFVNYLQIAKGSCGEVRAQLYVAFDVGYLDIETFKYLKGLAEEVSKLLASFIKKVKQSPHSGVQYKREKTENDRAIEEIMEAGKKAQEEAMRKAGYKNI